MCVCVCDIKRREIWKEELRKKGGVSEREGDYRNKVNITGKDTNTNNSKDEEKLKTNNITIIIPIFISTTKVLAVIVVLLTRSMYTS